jgi:hypothetical protein
MTVPVTERITQLNDRCRHGLDPNARIMVTRNCLARLSGDGEGIAEVLAQAALLAAVRRYAFQPGDGPERDFGAFDLQGQRVLFKILYEETVVKNTFCVSVPVRLPAPLPPYSDPIDWLRSFRGQLMHNPCIDLYPVEAEAAYHNPYSHPRIEQRRMRTKLLLGVSRRHQSSRSRIAPTRVALLSLLQHRHQTARSSAPCGTSPVSTKRQSAISNFRASATIPTLAARPPFPLKRLRYQTANSLLG